jgi:hypothetical protein
MPDLLRNLISGEIGDLAYDPTDRLDILRYLVGQTGLVNHDECSLGRIQ